MTIMTKMKGVATAFSFAALMSVGGASLASAEDVTLTMAVPDWPPTRIMKKFFDEQYKPKTRQHREARSRLHSVAGLLHPRQRLAHLGRAEVQLHRVGLAVARRLRRRRLFPQDQ